MKTSVALCTYNGEQFIGEQLNSILNQTLTIDEIVICDDCSTDTTVLILEEFCKAHPIIKLYKNEANLMSVKNFEKAISLCSGDLIFLSDQDDIWTVKKTEDYVRFFIANSEIDAVFSNGYLIDENGQLINKKTVWDIPELLRSHTIKFDFYEMITQIENLATGASMCFRSNIISEIIPFPELKNYHHDEWIATIVSKKNKLAFLNSKYFYYRLHSNQQIGGIIIQKFKKKHSELIEIFDISRNKMRFNSYKRKLRKLISSKVKNKNLYRLTENDIFNQNVSEIEKNIATLKKKFKHQYPFSFFLLTLFRRFDSPSKTL